MSMNVNPVRIVIGVALNALILKLPSCKPFKDFSFDSKLASKLAVSHLSQNHFLKALIVENIGVEPMTSCVQGRRSSQLS